MQRRNTQRRTTTFAMSFFGYRLHTALVPQVQYNCDRDRNWKCNQDNKHQQRKGYSAHHVAP
jgi:hypothetical protein